MANENFNDIFTPEVLKNLFPEGRTDDFFEALFGDVSEGAYSISLDFKEQSDNKLFFFFFLTQRPGKCLVCSLTYGLPEVFSRHPIINLNGLTKSIEEALDGKAKCVEWKVGATKEHSRALHTIPFVITLG